MLSLSASLLFNHVVSYLHEEEHHGKNVNGATHNSIVCLRKMPDTWRLPTLVNFHSNTHLACQAPNACAQHLIYVAV